MKAKKSFWDAHRTHFLVFTFLLFGSGGCYFASAGQTLVAVFNFVMSAGSLAELFYDFRGVL